MKITVDFEIPNYDDLHRKGYTDHGIVGPLIRVAQRPFDKTKPSWRVAGECPNKAEALAHLEAINALSSRDEIDARIAAAHYLIQAMNGGYKPENYDWFIVRAKKFDESYQLDDPLE